jgi:steroid 5-alpha reductase family enzyme
MLSSVLIALAMCLVIQIGFFVFAFLQKSDKFTDLSYGLTFVVVTVLYWLLSSVHGVQTIVTALVTLWGVRLAGYLYMRILKLKRDYRFDGVRENVRSFARFWLFQAISIWIILWPTLIVMSYEKIMKISVFTVTGTIIWIMGFWIETMADLQKSGFRSNPENNGKWVDVGLWHHSQYPNYFGEMSMWWGIFVISIPFLSGVTWLVILGPLFISCLLLFVTGIPPLAKKHKQEYGHLPEYVEYKRKTNLLVPWFKK